MEQEEEQNWAERYTTLLIHRVTTFPLNTAKKKTAKKNNWFLLPLG